MQVLPVVTAEPYDTQNISREHSDASLDKLKVSTYFIVKVSNSIS